MATIPRYPKVSTQNLVQSKGFDFDVPSPLSQAVGRRMAEQQAADAKLADMNASPLDKAVSALKATASMGTMLFQAIQQAPKALQGEDAYTEAIGNAAYIPQDPRALEYMGDFGNMLEKLETEYKIPNLMPELVPFQPLAGLARTQVNQAVEQGATRAGMAAERALEKPVTDIMNRGGRGAGLLSSFSTNPAQVVKEKGGNWLSQGLDDQRVLGDAGNGRAQQIWSRQQPDYQARYPERQQLAVANDTVADWANTQLRKYMVNQMGTRDDPVRKLAEKNISHFGMRPDEFGEYPHIIASPETKKLRADYVARTGESSPIAESSLAQYWENLSDNAIKATTVGDIKNAPNASYSLRAKKDIAPYADKVPPETPIYNIDMGDNYQTARQSLGFNRLMDVMREDIAAGRISPEEVAKWDMEQAVRHVDKRDKAILKAEAEEADRLAKEFSRYFPTIKEYPDNSRWIELKVPDFNSLPKDERLQLIDKLKKEANEKGIDPEQYVEDYPRMKLEEALANEGEKMGHCVGSYCEDVAEGRTRIFSYRDANGDPHVTMEVKPPEGGQYPVSGEAFARLPQAQKNQYREHVMQWRRRNPDVDELTDEHVMQALKEAGVEPQPDVIHQIKGKQDKRPIDQYIPFVQDFQRTTKYPIEGDFPNSGFDFPATGPRGIFDEDQVKTLRESGHEVPDYLTQTEREDLVRKLYEKETGNNFDTGEPLSPPTEGMKRGGQVHISDNPDTMALELNDKHLAGGGLLRKAAKLAMRDSDAMVTSARGASKFAEPKPKTMSVIKEKGGNWIGGNLIGDVDLSLRSKTPFINPKARVADKKAQIESMENAGSYSPRTIENAKKELLEEEMKLAINNWVTNNIGNYVKKEMATPNDPVRLMFEKRAQEIEAQYQVGMNRAQRLRERAEAEPDPRRQANLMRQAGQEEAQAKFDRDFASEHATHMPQYEFDEDALSSLQSKRKKAGFPAEGMAKSEPAQRWENISDEAIESYGAGKIQGSKQAQDELEAAQDAHKSLWNKISEDYLTQLKNLVRERGVDLTDEQIMRVADGTSINDKVKAVGLEDEFEKSAINYLEKQRNANPGYVEMGKENPWIAKLDPEAKVHSAYLGDLGIDHVIDVIRQDVEAGRIRPDQLNKLSMDQAVKRTAEFNMEQAKKMQETAIKATEGMPVHKEYPEGYKWIELAPKTPKPKGGGIAAGVGQDMWRKSEEPALAEALKYEGDTMGHCVGGYCPDVLEGRSRIYSLRDKRGEPHVTIEVGKAQGRTDPNDMQAINNQAHQEANANNFATTQEWNNFYNNRVKELKFDLIDKQQAETPPRIVQIKGKQNRAPKEDYLPYVQDFVRGGNWSDVGDLQNAGFVRIDPASDLAGRLNQANKEVPPYVTQDELTNLLKWHRGEADDELLNKLLPPPELPTEGMKAGGKVHVSDNPDSMMLDMEDQKFQVGGIVDVAARAAKAAKAAQMKKAMKASEALAQIEGKRLNVTQADRTKVGQGYLGGPGFSGLQLQEGPHKDVGAVWGVKNTGTAKTIVGGFDKPLGKEYFTTMIGSPTQHQSNQMVFDKLYGDFKKEAKKGNLDPELKDKINARLAAAVDKDGNPIFPPDVDILDKDFKKIVNTFDRRAVTGNLLGGVGVGGKKGQIIDYDKVIRDTTDPFLLDAPSGSMGYRLWTPSGEIIERPDLHPAFPAILTGEDLGVEFSPAAQDILMAPWVENVRQTKGRNPGYMDWTRGRPPSVEVTDKLLRNLEESGNKKGGLIKVKRKAGGGMISKVAREALERMKPAKAEMAARGAMWDKKMAEDASKYTRDIEPFNPSMEDIQAEIQRMQSKQDVQKAIGGAVYNTNPDMSDGGQIIQGNAFKRGGTVRDKFKRK